MTTKKQSKFWLSIVFHNGMPKWPQILLLPKNTTASKQYHGLGIKSETPEPFKNRLVFGPCSEPLWLINFHYDTLVEVQASNYVVSSQQMSSNPSHLIRKGILECENL